METYILGNCKSKKMILEELIGMADDKTVDSVSKMVRKGRLGFKLGEKDFKIPEENYPEKIELPEYDYKTDNLKCLELALILLDRIHDEDEIKLSSEEIEDLLVNRKNNTLNKKVFYALCDLRTDMTGVDISNTYIHGFDFRGLKNLVIDLDKVKDKDLINVNFNGVTLKGSLDDCKLYYTRFGGSINDLELDPQKIKHKFMKNTLLRDIKVVGSFDGVEIDGCDFDNTKGQVIINPQTLPDKRLKALNLGDCLFLDENGNPASFKGCTIYSCKFNNIKDGITLNLDDLEYFVEKDEFFGRTVKTKLCYCNLSGVTLTGDVLVSNLDTDLYYCYTSWVTFPNESATVDELNEYISGNWSSSCRHDIKLSDPKSYDKQDINVQINVMDKKKVMTKSLMNFLNSKIKRR